MGKTLTEIAQGLVDVTNREAAAKSIKVQLIYAFNGTGKTRLSREFKELVAPKREEELPIKIMYYNAFTEDLFSWDNDLAHDTDRKLLVTPNSYTKLALSFLQEEQQDGNIIKHFQRYTTNSITPRFKEDFTEITFDFQSGGSNNAESIKISKGEESNFIWCVFYSLIEHMIELLEEKKEDRSTAVFDGLEYVYIDDPVSSLDDKHLIELAVDLSKLIKRATALGLKFVVSTHNPLFYNVMFNELNREKNIRRYQLDKLTNGTFSLKDSKDSPFSYHILLLDILQDVVKTRNIDKYHFNMLRNILEKTSTYLSYGHWEELIPLYVSAAKVDNSIRLINLYSHSKHSGDETSIIEERDKDSFIEIFNQFIVIHSFKVK